MDGVKRSRRTAAAAASPSPSPLRRPPPEVKLIEGEGGEELILVSMWVRGYSGVLRGGKALSGLSFTMRTSDADHLANALLKVL